MLAGVGGNGSGSAVRVDERFSHRGGDDEGRAPVSAAGALRRVGDLARGMRWYLREVTGESG